MKYEFLEHTADLKFRAFGKTLEEAFESAVLAFASVIGKGEKIRARKKKVVELEGSDKENLLYAFLDELIYLLDAEGFVVAKGKVKIKGDDLKAELFGDDASRYKNLDHVKAATYAEMKVGRERGKWRVQAVLDV